MDKSQVLRRLREQANPENVKGMARFGITPRIGKILISLLAFWCWNRINYPNNYG